MIRTPATPWLFYNCAKTTKLIYFLIVYKYLSFLDIWGLINPITTITILSNLYIRKKTVHLFVFISGTKFTQLWSFQ